MIMNSHFPSWLSWKKHSVTCAATSARAGRTKAADLVFFNGSFPGAVFVDARGRKVFHFPSNGVVGKSLKPQNCFFLGFTKIIQIAPSDILTQPCFKIDVGSSKISSLMQALHFWGPLLKQ